jgi:hypothetical protein
MKEEKAKKDKAEEAKQLEKDRRQEEKRKIRHDHLQADLNQLKIEFQAKRDQKLKEEEEKKAKSPAKDPA